ncbi:MAG: hypothetical protein WD960_04990 [Gemmatimonadota bacterium]
MTTSVQLSGLEAGNPGAFLAALGVLDVASAAGCPARLRWIQSAGWRPEISGVESREDLVELVLADKQSDRDAEVLGFTYPRESGKKKGEPVGDLKADPDLLFRNLLAPVAARASQTDRSAADACAGLVAEGGVDNNGKSKPTAFHFTAGQQSFLEMVQELRSDVDRDHVTEGLFGPWRNPARLPAMGWDVANSREYALRATDPSTDPKTCQPAVEWLGVRGLRFFPCFVHRGQTITTAVRGSWKAGRFLWPVWTGWLDQFTVASLVAQDLEGISSVERRARGLEAVYEAGIQRSDQGGYGSFHPPRVLV